MTHSTEATYVHAERIRNHWWSRPGWAPGRSFYTFHLTFDGQHHLHQLVSRYQQPLAELPSLDLVAKQWLHLTIQGIGFTDETRTTDLEQIADAAAARLAPTHPIRLTFHRAVVFPESVIVAPAQVEAVQGIRTSLRAAIADVWGRDRVPDPDSGFRPHVSTAYCSKNQPADTIATVLDSVDPPPVAVTVAGVDLIELDRDDGFYRWRTHRTIPLGGR